MTYLHLYVWFTPTETLLDTDREVGLEVNSGGTKYMLMSRKKA
jgi:hypothetical protein